ncbi:ribonuclease [Streptomyces albidoflavus]|nr:ribonuclease [Streptomyces albidoflavus]
MRRLCWEPPADHGPAAVSAALAGYGARPWQIEQVTPLLVEALDAPAA